MSPPKLLRVDELLLGLAPQMVERLSEAQVEINGTGLRGLLVEQDVMTAFELAEAASVVETGRNGTHGRTKTLPEYPAIRQACFGM